MVPSKTAMKYLHHAKVIPEEDVPVGAHYRAREDMLQNVRGYKVLKDGLARRLCDIQHERTRAKTDVHFISTSGVELDKPYRCPYFRKKITVDKWMPRLNIFERSYRKSAAAAPVVVTST